MTENIVFEPIGMASSLIWMLIGLGVMLILMGYSWSKKYNILMMLGGFGTLIMLGSVFFTWLSLEKTIDVQVTATSIQSMHGTIDFDNINKVYIEEAVQSEGKDKGEKPKDRLLIVEPIKGNSLIALPEQTFDIDSIKKVIDTRYKAWKEK